jgi:glycosyltransferase involved in cell wall biosynthesis
MRKVFVLLEYYLPGYKAGGPLRTVSNMVDQLHDQFEFWIVTRDRDYADVVPYDGITVNSWNQVGKAKVYYASPGAISLKTLRRLLADVVPDAIYLNSFFSPLSRRYLAWRRLGLVPDVPVVLAPRGELSPGVLQLKAVKKKFYIWVAQRLRLYDSLTWQASAAQEVADIRLVCGHDPRVYIAPDLASLDLVYAAPKTSRPDKVVGQARLVFLSRIVPKKNLSYALQVLQQIRGDVKLDIYGPIEDMDYWHLCQHLMHNAMPPNIQVVYCGEVAHAAVARVLSDYHFFVLPTMGENFGHAILEALAFGCPVVISDQTPWRELTEQGVGWDISLADVDSWRAVLQQCVDMDHAAYVRMSAQSVEAARQWITQNAIVEQNTQLFELVLVP